jgi:SnoaL-like domain
VACEHVAMTTFDQSTDRQALRQLVEQYARGADTRDAELFADVFTDEAVLDTSRGEIRGRADLLKIAPRLGRYRATMHMVGNHYITFNDADHADGVTYCEASHMREVEGVDWVYVMRIVYHDVYVREPRGWRMSNRRLDLLWDEDRPLKAG